MLTRLRRRAPVNPRQRGSRPYPCPEGALDPRRSARVMRKLLTRGQT
jgi:hypothetical protein